MRKISALSITKRYLDALAKEGLPVQKVYLYGSYASDTAHEDSDIDIAVVCVPFKGTRHEENMELRRIRRDIDPNISPYCFHADDFNNDYFALPHEVIRHGIEVS